MVCPRRDPGPVEPFQVFCHSAERAGWASRLEEVYPVSVWELYSHFRQAVIWGIWGERRRSMGRNVRRWLCMMRRRIY